MKIQEVRSRLQQVIDESKSELTELIKSAKTYEDWKSIGKQIDEILAVVNGIEFVEKLLKDKPKTKTE